MKRRKLLLMSHSLPPVMSGSGIIVKHLFDYFKKDTYVALTSYCKGEDKRIRTTQNLHCRYYFSALESFFNPYNRRMRILEWLQVLPAILQGLLVIKKETISDLLVIPTGGNFLLTAYFMHLFSRKSLSIYFLDLFTENKP